MIDNERDVRLMLRVASDDDVEALHQLYEAYRGPLCKFLYYCVFDYSLAEDYFQEVFLRLWRSRKRYRASGKFSTFIFQIAKNYFLNEREKKLRRPKVLSLDAKRVDREGEEYRDQQESPVQAPPEQMALSETNQILHGAIESLPEKHRLVFQLAQVQGMKYREISKILDIPVGTVKSRMSKAVRLLREKLRGRWKDHEEQGE